MGARSTWIPWLAGSAASCVIVAACASRSGTTFGVSDAGYATYDASSFGVADGGLGEFAQCNCDGGALEIHVSGDGADQILTDSNPRGGCASTGPSGYFFSCGSTDWTTAQIAACARGGGACIIFDKTAQLAGYVDRDGGVWDLSVAAIDLDDGGALGTIMSGVFAVEATRAGCEGAACAIDLAGSFRVCATGERVYGCE